MGYCIPCEESLSQGMFLQLRKCDGNSNRFVTYNKKW